MPQESKACLLYVTYTNKKSPTSKHSRDFGPVPDEKSAANLTSTLNEMIEGLGWPVDAAVQNVKFGYKLTEVTLPGEMDDYYTVFLSAFNWASKHFPKKPKAKESPPHH